VPDSFKIHFNGPYGLSGQHNRLLFGEPISQKAGVYLWTVRTSDGFIVEYVGQTGESFAKRTKDHMIQTFGGNYRVCDPQLLRQGEVKVVWLGLWRKGTEDKMAEFAQRYLELAPVIQEYLEAIELFLAPVTGDRRMRERIEGAIAHQIREQSAPASSLLPHGHTLQTENAGRSVIVGGYRMRSGGTRDSITVDRVRMGDLLHSSFTRYQRIDPASSEETLFSAFRLKHLLYHIR
jgi:hypothetical protein